MDIFGNKLAHLEEEIFYKSGKLWDKSVQRIRDKALSLTFPKTFHGKIGLYAYQTPQGKLVSPCDLGSEVDDYLDDHSNQYLRHLNTNVVRDLHFETSFVNTAFLQHVYNPKKNGDVCDKTIAKRLSSLYQRHLPAIYEESKKVLSAIGSRFDQLLSIAKIKAASLIKPEIDDSIGELMDFLGCLCHPHQKCAPRCVKSDGTEQGLKALPAFFAHSFDI